MPIANYNELNQSQAVATVKDLTEAAGIRSIVVYEEATRTAHVWCLLPKRDWQQLHKRSLVSTEAIAASYVGDRTWLSQRPDWRPGLPRDHSSRSVAELRSVCARQV